MKTAMAIKTYLNKRLFYRRMVFYLRLIRYFLFKSHTPAQADPSHSGKFRTALNGKVRIYDEEFLELRDLLVYLDPNNEPLPVIPYSKPATHWVYLDPNNEPLPVRFNIGGHSISKLAEFDTLPQNGSDFQEDANAADLTIDQPVMLYKPDWRLGNIAHCMHFIYIYYVLLRAYDLQPKEVAFLYLPCSEKDQKVKNKFLILQKTMFKEYLGEIGEESFGKPTQKILLKRALMHIKGNSEFRVGPLFPELGKWITESFQVEVKSKTRKVEKIVLIERKESRIIANIDELCDVIQAQVPNCTFARARLELLPIAEQIALLANADIVIGVHGAGLVLASYVMRENTGIIELLPAQSEYRFNYIFTIIPNACRLKGIHYERRYQIRKKQRISENYAEKYGTLEPEKIVDYYPPQAVVKKIDKLTRRIEECAR